MTNKEVLNMDFIDLWNLAKNTLKLPEMEYLTINHSKEEIQDSIIEFYSSSIPGVK